MRWQVAVLVMLLVPLSGAAPGRMDIEPYVMANGYVSLAFFFCDTQEGNVGGVCFRLTGHEQFVELEITSDVDSEARIAGAARFYDKDNALLERTEFCSRSDPLLVPGGARKLTTHVGFVGEGDSKVRACQWHEDTARAHIPTSTLPAHGNVTARFY